MEIKAFGLESLQNCPEITAQLSEREKELLTFFFFFFLTTFPEIFHWINYDQKCYLPLLAGI